MRTLPTDGTEVALQVPLALPPPRLPRLEREKRGTDISMKKVDEHRRPSFPSPESQGPHAKDTNIYQSRGPKYIKHF